MAIVLTSSSPQAAPPAAVPVTTTPAQPVCPLTGAPPPSGGAVPQLPALAVKVDNYPAGRPQAGLDHADIVFEEPVEGMITRYVAVFQCQQASLIGPIRSARNIDIGILGEFGDPLLVSVGGINPVISNIENSPIQEIDLRDHGSVVQTVAGRQAPYATFASTSALWELDPKDTGPPNPVFRYATTAPTGMPASSITIPFSQDSDVTWRYDSALGTYLRYYGTTPDVLLDGVQNSASNIVVQFVHIFYGPWYENDVGGLEVQATLYPDASGKAEVFRNGVEISGTWHRSTLASPTQFLSSTGAEIPLQPGRTWVELVPDTVTVSVGP